MNVLPADTPAFVTVRDFQKLTGTSRSFAYRLIREGRVGTVRLGVRSAIRIPRQELRRFLEECVEKRESDDAG